jgi:hypothetical protein
VDGGAVGSGDRADDRQAEAVMAVGRGGAVAAEPVEWLEQPVELVRANHQSGVGNGQDRKPGFGLGTDLYGPVGVVVTHGVVDQVRHQALDQGRLADDRGGRVSGLTCWNNSFDNLEVALKSTAADG